MQIMLVGNPNCGKTTLFNAWTNSHQPVGNWSGVTVKQHLGIAFHAKQQFNIIDLPGVYSLNLDKTSVKHDIAPDMLITTNAIFNDKCDVLINIIDACCLERHLYLTTQLLELGKPVIIVLTMLDKAAKCGININLAALSHLLNVPVLAIDASKGSDIDVLNKTILHTQSNLQSAHMHTTLSECDLDNEALATARYARIQKIVEQVLTQHAAERARVTAWLDKILLQRFLALPIFLLVMYSIFGLAVHVGSALQVTCAPLTDLLFIRGISWVLQLFSAPHWLYILFVEGIGMGIKTTLMFIPVLSIMFFCLAVLEDTGYMARAAFIMDRMMRYIGLPGKAFIPLMLGFGCNVPAVMATRTLSNARDRILTMMMTPFMSCGARLTIYTVFVAAFFPKGGQNIIFSLYLLGMIMAVFTGILLRHTLLSKQNTPLILELPSYQQPSILKLLQTTWLRLKNFLFRSSRLIIAVCMLLGCLNAIYWSEGISLLAWIGKNLTPLFAPMGISAQNWPATVGLLTGIIAKEVVIGTLNQLYSTISTGASYGVMVVSFGSSAAAYAYLLFVLLYIPCISTMAVIKQESNRSLMLYSTIWSLILAYTVAVIFYQVSTIAEHPLQTILWSMGLGSVIYLAYLWLANSTKNSIKNDQNTSFSAIRCSFTSCKLRCDSRK